jgi:nucleoside-diphosphate-sugar epimerase
MIAPRKVGVTGATGQVGSRLLRHLQAAGIPAVAVVRNQLGAALCSAGAPDCEIRIGSLTPAAGEPHVLDDCDVIVNCALEGSGGIPRQAYTRNRALVDGLLKAKSLKWLVHFSTVAVYGELITAARDPERERRQPHPHSEYGRSKLYVEQYAAAQSRRRGIDCTIVRLGHVYGAGIARSREIIEFSRDPKFRLPFDGRLSSNAIHVDAVGAAIAALLRRGPSGDVVSLAESHHTWRDIFDWHTAALGLTPVAAMAEDESAAQRRGWTDRSPVLDAVRWLRGLPVKSLVRSPSTFDLALRVLVRTPASITRLATDVNRRTGARSQIARVNASGSFEIPSLYLSDGMPGPFLDLPEPPARGLGSEGERARELEHWADLWTTPRWRAAAFTAPRETGGRDLQPWS